MVTMSWMLLLCVLAGGHGSEVGVQEGCSRWMGGVPGTPGLDGQDGRDGREGRQGETGDTGLPGVRGERGELGEVGEDGVQGQRGFPGAPGLQGQRGESSFLYRSAFSVGLTTPTTTTDTPLHFAKIFYNEQHHYDDISGKFRCFIPGVYYFTFHLTVQGQGCKVGLYRNGRVILLTLDQFLTSDLDQSSGGAVLNLSSGDQVWLQVYGAEQEEVGIYADINNDSTFTGFLIQARLPSSPLDNRRR
ncbi:adiponectin isoform X1 [Coregonus clupeaformis]|uniref:adiponectin isoform X1 n=1 Tax=Coregonus clupeaformis TaxID=59861 RepID=UPI001BE0AB85|nr:adiponectin isoform X1 [Coregonus clupeaformis]